MFPRPVPARRNNNKTRPRIERSAHVARDLWFSMGRRVLPPPSPGASGARKTCYFGFLLLSHSAKHRTEGQSRAKRSTGGGGDKDGKETKINSPSANGYQNVENTDRVRTADPSCRTRAENGRLGRVPRTTPAERIAGSGNFFSRPEQWRNLGQRAVSSDTRPPLEGLRRCKLTLF